MISQVLDLLSNKQKSLYKQKFSTGFMPRNICLTLFDMGGGGRQAAINLTNFGLFLCKSDLSAAM